MQPMRRLSVRADDGPGIFRSAPTFKEIGFKRKDFHFEFSRIKKIIQIGFPSAIGQSGSALGFLILNVFITAYGTDVLAAYSMVNRISGLLTQPSMGFGGALTSVAGQNMGANQKDRVKEAFSKTMTMSLLFGIIGATIMYFFRYPLLHFFIKDQSGAVFQEAIPYLMYSLLIIPLMGIFNVLMGLFNGTGNTNYSMQMTVGRLWVLRIPMVLSLSILPTWEVRESGSVCYSVTCLR